MDARASHGGAARASPVAGFSATSRPCWLNGRMLLPRDCCATKHAKHRGVEMKRTLAIATIAIIYAAGHPAATTVDMPLARRAPSFILTQVAGQNTGNVWNGRWQGTTVSGVQLVLQLQAEGQRLMG